MDRSSYRGRTIGSCHKHPHRVHVYSARLLRREQRSHYDLERSRGGNRQSGQSEPYPRIDDSGSGGNLNITAKLGLHNDWNIVEVIELLGKGNKNPGIGGYGDSAGEADGKESGLIYLVIGRSDRSEHYRPVSHRCHRVDDRTRDKQLRIVGIGSSSSRCRHRQEYVFGDE